MKKRVKSALSARDFLQLGGNYRDIRIMRVSTRKYTRDSAELHLLERYYHLLVHTDYLRDEVYDFLVGQKTYKNIAEDRGIKESYLRNIIYKGIKRIYDDLEEDPFALIRYECEEEEKAVRVEVVTERIEIIISRHNLIIADDLNDFMVVGLGEYADKYTEYEGDIEEDIFYDTIDRLKYLSQPYLTTLFKQMDTRVLGYIIYLLSTKDNNLSERDRSKKHTIREMWFLPDNI